MAQAQLELRPHVGAHPELRAEAAPDDQDPSGSPREEDLRSSLKKLKRKRDKEYANLRKKYAENKEYRENKLANLRKKYAEDEEYREKRKMSVQGYKKDNKAKIAAYKRKKYAEDEEYRVRTKMIARRYRENKKAKIAMVARMARAREKKEMYRVYREKGLLPKALFAISPPQKAKMARIVREARMELDEVREKELFEQMLTAQANLLKHVADVVVVCRAQCERLQQPRA